MSNHSPTTTWTPGQIACAMVEISESASALHRILMILEATSNDDDHRDTEALMHAAECLTQRMGWLADATAVNSAPGHISHDVKTPLAWTMPPIFEHYGKVQP